MPDAASPRFAIDIGQGYGYKEALRKGSARPTCADSALGYRDRAKKKEERGERILHVQRPLMPNNHTDLESVCYGCLDDPSSSWWRPYLIQFSSQPDRLALG